MRTIKFRYRYTNGKDWIFKSFTLAEIVNGEPFEVLSDMPMYRDFKHVGEDEFTGLFDKDKTEIYENDMFFEDNNYYKIEYRNGSYKAVKITNNKTIRVAHVVGIGSWAKRVKIIGNIHQHNHLLNQ